MRQEPEDAEAVIRRDYHNPVARQTFAIEVSRRSCALIVAAPVSLFYQSPILVYVLPLSGFGIVLSGFTSVSLHLLQKRMQMVKLNAFEMVMSAVSSAAHILFAWISPTVWGLAFGGLISSAATMLGSYFLLSSVKQRFQFSRRYSRDILGFGKWIFVSSIVFFLSTNFDRLYFAKIVPLNILGVYGIARSISELVGLLVWRIGNYVLFPLIASHALMPRADLREQLAPQGMESRLGGASMRVC